MLNVELHSLKATDNFFQYGGNSLTAIRLSSMALRAGLRLSVAAIFRHPQLEDMGKQCKRIPKQADGDGPSPFSLVGGSDQPELFAEIAEGCKTSVSSIEDVYPCTVHPFNRAWLLLRPTVTLPISTWAGRF